MFGKKKPQAPKKTAREEIHSLRKFVDELAQEITEDARFAPDVIQHVHGDLRHLYYRRFHAILERYADPAQEI
jgi:predicted trehalose synthase